MTLDTELARIDHGRGSRCAGRSASARMSDLEPGSKPKPIPAPRQAVASSPNPHADPEPKPPKLSAKPKAGEPARLDCYRGHRLSDVMGAVNKATGVKYVQIKGRGDSKRVRDARHLFCLLARQRTWFSSLKIGAFLERDHTTILYGALRAEDIMKFDPALRAAHDRAVAILDGGAA